MRLSTSKNRVTSTLASAALSGLMIGATGYVAGCHDSSNPNAGTSVSSPAAVGEHACKGMNSCKGQGGCKTGDNGCKGKNSCKGNGGCKTM